MEKKANVFLHFLGASGTVTGSKYLVETPDRKILIDCGLFQGLKELRLLNWNYLPVDAASIDCVILTHGHLDHVGYLPCIVKAGFKGKIYGTEPTLAIAEIILKDSAKIQEEEAYRANKYGYSKHKPALPLYEVKEIGEVTKLFSPLPLDEWITLGATSKVRLQTNGHIIGSTFIEMELEGKRLVFSGDIGQNEDLLMFPPKQPEKADILLMESTYGDRLHFREDTKAHLRKIVLETIAKGGTLIIPSFAVERAQLLMFLLYQLSLDHSIPDIPKIIDTPMGANVLSVFDKFSSWHKLDKKICDEMCSMFTVVKDFKETEHVIANPFPKIVIAGSGMISGGRVLSYLEHYLEKPETTIMLAGYMGAGTRGRKLQEGADELKIYGKSYKVKARIENMEGLSAHADQNDLLGWLAMIKNKPEKVFIVHGEKAASETLCRKIKDKYDWKCTVPHLYDIVQII
jgi:metallo-beta-lactamase family protein